MAASLHLMWKTRLYCQLLLAASNQLKVQTLQRLWYSRTAPVLKAMDLIRACHLRSFGRASW